MHYFYMRVSTNKQNTDRQLIEFMEYIRKNDIDKYQIIEEKYTGKTMKRDKLSGLLKLIENGDTLVIKELDRLGRNYNELGKLWKDLTIRGINIICLDMPMLNTENKTDLEKTLISDITFTLLNYMAEKERQKISQRTKEGLAAKKAQGVALGRPKIFAEALPKDFDQYVKLIEKKKLSKTQVSNLLNISRPTLDRYIKLYNNMEG